MIFYKNTFYFISFLLLPTAFFHNKELRIIKSGLAPVTVCKIGLEFFTELDNTSSEDVHVELIPDECCLKTDDGEDCDSIQIIGECSEVIPKETTKTLSLVAPLLDPFERVGHCIIHIDSRPVDRKRDIMRDTLDIHFNTRFKDNITEEYLKHCENIDEDPLDDCKPVNCDTYYNGKKSYFDKHAQRCREVPDCVDRKRSKSNQIYDPITNTCVDASSINEDDINFIKSLLGKERYPKDILLINSVSKPVEKVTTELPENIFKQQNIINKTNAKILKLKSKILCHSSVKYIFSNKYTLIVLTLVVTLQCCLIMTLVYCLTDNCCCTKKKVVSKFFNYRQDASVTTPLIGTSNMDTETTEFDYISDSSNIEKKIKCYKACQKQGQENAKISMSDDILLKCLNRRDWNSQPKSETKRETIITDNISNQKQEDNESDDDNKDENSLKNGKNTLESNSVLAEKEIKCHNYNLAQTKVDFKATDDTNIKGSVTTNKGAQACFSNDSMDDFLSERGMVFFGENASKYSFTSTTSPDKSSLTELTSKTSKNNIIKNVLSYLSKSKHGTSSDPGAKKSKSKSKDLELIHISHASVYSSSSELNNVKCVKLVKESRSTF